MDILIDNLKGMCVPEGRIEDRVAILVVRAQLGLDIPPIGQNELVQGIRLAVKEGRLKDVRFVFGNVIVSVLPDGQIDEWPEGFPGHTFDKQLSNLLS